MFAGIGGFEYGIQKAESSQRNNEQFANRRDEKESRFSCNPDGIEQATNKESFQTRTRSTSYLQSRRDSTHNPRDAWENCKNNTKLECIGFSEIDKYAIATYQKHFPNHKNYGDATKINPSELPDFDMLCAGFPCQAFSIAGKRRGFADTRGTLFFEITRVLEAKRPAFVFLENVKGLLNHDKGQTFRTIIQTLSELGYDVQWMVLNSKFFGVPQNRERVFIIGSIRGEPRPEILPFRKISSEVNELYGQQTNSIKARYTAIGDGSYVAKSKLDAQGYRVMKINAATKQGYSEAEVGDGIRLEYPESKTARGRVIKQNSNALKSGTEGVVVMDLYNKVEHSDRSSALTELHHNTSRVREGMKIRRLTPTECARLQGFPDDWALGSDTQKYKQYGNAVTTNVIKAIMMAWKLNEK